MNFRSKIDLWLVAVLFAAVIPPLLAMVYALREGQPWLLHFAIALALAGLFSWLLASTKYTVSSDLLFIYCGPFSWRVQLKDINRVVESRSLASSPALSLDRLRIEYDHGRRSILVSPANKAEFIKAIGIAGVAA